MRISLKANTRNLLQRGHLRWRAKQSVFGLKHGRLFPSSRKYVRLPAASTSSGRKLHLQSNLRREAGQIVFGSRHGKLFLNLQKYVRLPGNRLKNHPPR